MDSETGHQGKFRLQVKEMVNMKSKTCLQEEVSMAMLLGNSQEDELLLPSAVWESRARGHPDLPSLHFLYYLVSAFFDMKGVERSNLIFYVKSNIIRLYYIIIIIAKIWKNRWPKTFRNENSCSVRIICVCVVESNTKYFEVSFYPKNLICICDCEDLC